MQQTLSFATISLCALLAVSGCSKKSEHSKPHKKTTSLKTKHKKSHDSTAHEAIKAFDLDNDSMKTFALDDKLDQHQKHTPTPPANTNQLFAWENIASEESKDSFKKLPFEFDSYSLQKENLDDLKHNIKQAKKMSKQNKKLVVEGHACHSAGSAIYNLALSEKRARHVAKLLADAGVNPANIKIAPRGQEMPIRKGGTRAEQAVNRRAELFAIDSN